MIIKGQSRARARQLATHLLRADQNESIGLHECRGTIAQDVAGALIEMETRGRAARSERPLYHASISPEAATPLTEDQIGQAVDLLEERLGFHGQPRVVVLHRKKGREHVHVVWSRIDVDRGTAIADSWNYRLHEKAARELEALFGHRPVQGSQGRRRRRGSRRTVQDHELRQAERSGIPIGLVSGELTALWRGARDGAEFRRTLEGAGYILARGDRRVFVVIDRSGGVHSLARRIEGVDAAMLRERLRDLSLNQLPSVAEARASVTSIKTRHSSRQLGIAFVRASREVGHRAGQVRPVQEITLKARANARAMIAPDTNVRSQLMRIAADRRDFPGYSVKPISPYRSARAALIAEYASRIAQALRYTPPHEVDAVIAALRAEREAALDALYSARPLNTRGKRRRRKDVSPAMVRVLRSRVRLWSRVNRKLW